jgi:tetratricopeptide (TPR) repeat protein
VLLRSWIPLLGLSLLAAPVVAADAWHLPDWTCRAVVAIPAPSTEEGVDAAGVKILCQGHAKPDGSDYRVLDAAGKAVLFQLDFHDADHYSLLTFKTDNPKQIFFVYFGNPKAAQAAEQTADFPAPGAGQPTGGWVPHSDFVYQTVDRPRAEDIAKEHDPDNIDEMTKLLAGSKGKHGARWQRRVSDGYNPFGSSDYYISIYRGWVRLPKAGAYQFCTVSNKASFSFLDGKPLIHWPGQHTTERGVHGEVNVKVDLTAGLHYLEYYHETTPLEHMAYLAWRPSGDPGQFSPIPESFYTAPHVAVVTAYEDAKGPLLYFEPVIADSVWPVERNEGQYTHVKFAVGKTPALPEGTIYQWDFGDGQTAAGLEVEHVYLTLGLFNVTLTAQAPSGMQTARWPLTIFEIEHVTDQFKEGRPKDYAKLAKAYDRSKLTAEALQELQHLLAEGDEPAEAVEVGKTFLQRFPTAEPLTQGRVRRLMADAAVRMGKDNLDEAIANYEAALVKETPAAEKLDVLAHLIRLVGVEREQPEKAAPIFGRAEETLKTAKVNDEVQAAYRRTLIAMGDVRMWQGKLDDARAQYGKAEKLGDFIPSQVRAARLGAYPDSLQEYLDTGNTGAALDLVDKWDEKFPTDKPSGHSLFWRGKVLLRRSQPQDATRFLDRAMRLTPGAPFETEARWLLAEALDQVGKKDEAKRELAKLVAVGIADEFTKKAIEKLKKQN